MQWYYANGNQPVGPVEEASFQALIKAGTIGPETMVWREGMPEWLPYKTVGGSSVLPPKITNQAQCIECRQWFALDDLIQYEGRCICARCKPIFFQKLQEGVNQTVDGAWRRGKVVILSKNAMLPDRCIKCNSPANGFRLTRKLYWHSPWLYLLIFVSILIYALVALVVRKRAIVPLGLCEAHRQKRNLKMMIAGGCTALFLVFLIVGISRSNGGLALLSLVFFLVGIGFGVASTPIAAQRIDDRFVLLKGAGREFLASLPEWIE